MAETLEATLTELRNSLEAKEKAESDLTDSEAKQREVRAEIRKAIEDLQRKLAPLEALDVDIRAKTKGAFEAAARYFERISVVRESLANGGAIKKGLQEVEEQAKNKFAGGDDAKLKKLLKAVSDHDKTIAATIDTVSKARKKVDERQKDFDKAEDELAQDRESLERLFRVINTFARMAVRSHEIALKSIGKIRELIEAGDHEAVVHLSDLRERVERLANNLVLDDDPDKAKFDADRENEQKLAAKMRKEWGKVRVDIDEKAAEVNQKRSTLDAAKKALKVATDAAGPAVEKRVEDATKAVKTAAGS